MCGEGVFKRLKRCTRFSLISNQDGQSLVEFALTIPVLLLFLIGIVNFGFIMFTYLNMNLTVQEASRLTGLGQSDCQVAAYTWNHLPLKNADKIVLPTCSSDDTTADSHSLVMSISPDPSTRKSGDYVTVTLKYPMDNLTPIFDQFLSTLNLQATSTIRVE